MVGSLLSLLIGVVVAVFFLVVFSQHVEPPGPPSWEDNLALLGPVALLLALWIAARHWYSSPLFFAYGAFLMVPLGWGIFGPQTRHGFQGPVPPYAAVKTLAFCIGGGLLAAFVGWLSRHEQAVAGRKHRLSVDDRDV